MASVKNKKLGKLNIANCKIISTGTSFPADFLNCSTKSPTNNIAPKIKCGH